MADGFIVRKGGAVGTKAPSINFVSKTDSEIVFTITNNDTATADIFWEVGDNTPDANQLSLAGETTSGNITASGLTQNTQYTIFVFANAANKAGSDTVSLTQTTDELTYIDATGGTTETYEDNGTFYKTHTFTSSGNFVVNSVGNALGGGDQVDYLIVAGGGGSNIGSWAGGSGAGGLLNGQTNITNTSYTISIGAGGTGAPDNSTTASNGENSSALGFTTIGGGSGAGTNFAATIGGSGGGGAGTANTSGANGTSGQGNAGGNGAGDEFGGGGGGAGFAGEIGTSGNGGDGLEISITGTPTYYAGGGGGNNQGVGGLGGGGNDAENGQANTGGGGGAEGANGGSGIVIIRYEVGGL